MIGKKFVIKVAKEGRDVRSGDLTDYTFHSDNASLKMNIAANPKHSDIVPFTFVDEPAAGTTVMFKIPHGYDFTPAINAFVGDPSFKFSATQPDNEISYFRTPFRRSLDFMSGSASTYSVTVDRHNIYFLVVRSGTAWNVVKGTTVYVKYNIFDMKGLE